MVVLFYLVLVWRDNGIDISAGDDCPIGWLKSSHNGVSFYRAPSENDGCYSTFFSTNEVSYQHVCERARGYQKGQPEGFYTTLSIDTYYNYCNRPIHNTW